MNTLKAFATYFFFPKQYKNLEQYLAKPFIFIILYLLIYINNGVSYLIINNGVGDLPLTMVMGLLLLYSFSTLLLFFVGLLLYTTVFRYVAGYFSVKPSYPSLWYAFSTVFASTVLFQLFSGFLSPVLPVIWMIAIVIAYVNYCTLMTTASLLNVAFTRAIYITGTTSIVVIFIIAMSGAILFTFLPIPDH